MESPATLAMPCFCALAKQSFAHVLDSGFPEAAALTDALISALSGLRLDADVSAQKHGAATARGQNNQDRNQQRYVDRMTLKVLLLIETAYFT